MGKTHPIEPRARVMGYVDDGHGHREAARHFQVSPKFVNDLVKRRRETGSLAPASRPSILASCSSLAIVIPLSPMVSRTSGATIGNSPAWPSGPDPDHPRGGFSAMLRLPPESCRANRLDRRR